MKATMRKQNVGEREERRGEEGLKVVDANRIIISVLPINWEKYRK
jgi:hypothetical protein